MPLVDAMAQLQVPETTGAQPPKVQELSLAEKVLGIAELMLHIFSYLPATDAASAYAACDYMRDIVEGSQALMRSIGLLADLNADPQLPFLLNQDCSNIEGIHFKKPSGIWNRHFRDWYIQRVYFYLDYYPLRAPKLSPIARRLLICQPPVKKLSYMKHWESFGVGKIIPKHGSYITMGDVEDAATELLAAHECSGEVWDRLCIAGNLSAHMISFTGRIQLADDAPLMKRRRDAWYERQNGRSRQ